jgi:hypothetical protein
MLVKQELQDPIRLKKSFRNIERNLWYQAQPRRAGGASLNRGYRINRP